jgi:hypothetical protein
VGRGDINKTDAYCQEDAPRPPPDSWERVELPGWKAVPLKDKEDFMVKVPGEA